MKMHITCTVNGEEHTVVADTRDTLLDLLRDRIGLTGTKEGCGNGNCGTCTVIVDGAAVNACLMLAQEAPGLEIVTIEGLSKGGALHPIQRALVEHGVLFAVHRAGDKGFHGRTCSCSAAQHSARARAVSTATRERR